MMNFKRSPRMFHRIEKVEIQVNRPSDRKKMEKGSIVQIVVPPLAMTAVTAGLGIMMGRGTYILISLAGTAMTVLFSVVTFLKEKRRAKKKTHFENRCMRLICWKKEKKSTDSISRKKMHTGIIIRP